MEKSRLLNPDKVIAAHSVQNLIECTIYSNGPAFRVCPNPLSVEKFDPSGYMSKRTYKVSMDFMLDPKNKA